MAGIAMPSVWLESLCLFACSYLCIADIVSYPNELISSVGSLSISSNTEDLSLNPRRPLQMQIRVNQSQWISQLRFRWRPLLGQALLVPKLKQESTIAIHFRPTWGTWPSAKKDVNLKWEALVCCYGRLEAHDPPCCYIRLFSWSYSYTWDSCQKPMIPLTSSRSTSEHWQDMRESFFAVISTLAKELRKVRPRHVSVHC